jgi:hypothetical protein
MKTIKEGAARAAKGRLLVASMLVAVGSAWGGGNSVAAATNLVHAPKVVEANPKAGDVITFPEIGQSNSWTHDASWSAKYPTGFSGSNATVTAPGFFFEAKVTKETTSENVPGEVTLTSVGLQSQGAKVTLTGTTGDQNTALLPYVKGLLKAPIIPEFIWVYNKTSKKYLSYRVTEIDDDFLTYIIGTKEVDGQTVPAATETGGVATADYFTGDNATPIEKLYFSGHIPKINKTIKTYGLLKHFSGAAADGFRLGVDASYAQTDNGALTGRSSAFILGSSFNNNSELDGNVVVIGGYEVANNLKFLASSSKDVIRDKELTKDELAWLISIVAPITKVDEATGKTSSVVLNLGHSPATSASDELKLGAELFEAAGAAEAFRDIEFEASVTGDLQASGFAKLTGKFHRIFARNADVTKLKFGGDSLFAGLVGAASYTSTYPYPWNVALVALPQATAVTGSTTEFTGGIDHIGDAWFAGSKVAIQGSGYVDQYNELKNVKYIGTSAFEGALITQASSFKTFAKLDSIAPKAFKQVTDGSVADKKSFNLANLTPGTIRVLGDSAFFDIDILTGFDGLTKVEKLGTDVFHTTSIVVGTSDLTALNVQNTTQAGIPAEDGTVKAISLPFTKPFAAGAKAFNGAKFVYGSGSNFTDLTDQKTFILGSQAANGAIDFEPSAELDADAFAGQTLYVPLALLSSWSAALPSATVRPYDLPKTVSGNDANVVKLQDRNGKSLGWSISFEDILTDYTRLVFNPGTTGYSLYSISGQAEVEGFTTAEDGEPVEIDEIEGQGIDLQGLAWESGFYAIKLYKGYSDKTPLQFTLTVTPTDLEDLGYEADTLFIDYSGSELAKVLATFDSSAFKLLKNPGVDEAKDYFELGAVKVGSLTAIANYSALTALGTGKTFGVIVPFKVSLAGNSAGTFEIPVAVKQVAIDTAVVEVPNLDFAIATKSYDLDQKEVTLAGEDTFEYKVKVYNPLKEGYQAPTGDDALAWLTVKYKDDKVPTTIGKHEVKLIGNGYLTDSVEVTFEVQAAWSSIAVISTNPTDYKLGKSYDFDGSVQVSSFAGLIKTELSAADYELVAAKDFKEGKDDITKATLLKGDLSAAGEYSFFLVPAGKYLYPTGTYKLTDATYVGFIQITALTHEKLTAAAVLSETEAAEDEAEDAPVKYEVSFGKVYVGKEDSVVTKADGVYVYFSEADAASIKEGGVLKLKLPEGDPDGLSIVEYTHDGYFGFLVDGELNLIEKLKTTNVPKIDWKSQLTFVLSDLDAKHLSVSPEGVVTAVDEWNGTVNVVYTYEDSKKKPEVVKVSVSAYSEANEPPTSVEAVLAGDASAVYYTLGGVAVQGTPSKAGLYIVKVGDKVGKVLVK